MLDALSLDQMRMFIAVAETGSFHAAAKRLSRVQSAVSHSIRMLESELEVRLFDRSGRRPQLTVEGRALLADMRAILLKVDTVRARARSLSEGLEVELAIAVDPQFPLPLVAAAFGKLRDTYPSVGVRIRSTRLGAAIAALRAGACSLAIAGDNVPDPGIHLEDLSFAWRVAVVAPGHALADQARTPRVLAPIDLADHVQIVAEDPSKLTEGRDFDVLSPQTWRVSDDIMKHQLILAGLGWGTLPLWMVERDVLEGRLVRVAAAAFGVRGQTLWRLYLAHKTDQPLGPAAGLFRTLLLENVKEAGLHKP